MEGEKVVKDICLTESSELKHYGSSAVFVYDPEDTSNRPVRGIHDNVIKFWRLYPQYIKDAFITSFTTGLTEPNKRIIENEWQKMFIRLRSEIIMCSCGRTNFTSMFVKLDDKTYRCPKCGMQFSSLSINHLDYRIPLYVGCRFFECDIDRDSDDFLTVSGELVENKLKAGLLGIKNTSEKIWSVKFPDESVRDVPPGNGFPVWPGLEIDFGGGVQAKI